VLLGAAAILIGVALASPAREADVAEVPQRVFDQRRARLADALPADGRPVTIESGDKPKGDYDIDFRPSSDFVYLTGLLDVPFASVIVWREDGEPRDALVLRRPNRRMARWEVQPLGPDDEAAQALGFDHVLARGSEEAAELIAKLGEPAGGAALNALHAARLVKDEHELARLQRSIDITARALAEGMRSCRPGMNEEELDALIRYVFRRDGARRAGFPSIVGSGPNSCTLHYTENRRVMREGDLVVCDVGAEYERYSADITRTFPVSGRFTERQREVYEAVLEAQQAGIDAVKPGATIRQVHRAALDVLAGHGLDRYSFHGTCHWLGLDVHDVGSMGTPLRPGMVLTVEPGAYIDSESIGIRIEDDVLVTETGSKVLSAGVPKHPDEIEALMKEQGIGNVKVRGYRARRSGELEKKGSF
jgi:Xaa-Pro aminopeptidase